MNTNEDEFGQNYGISNLNARLFHFCADYCDLWPVASRFRLSEGRVPPEFEIPLVGGCISFLSPTPALFVIRISNLFRISSFEFWDLPIIIRFPVGP